MRFHIITWQESSIIVASETRTYPGSKVSLQIGISKLSLMERYLLLQLEFHRVKYLYLSCSRNTSVTCPQESSSLHFADAGLLYRVIRDQMDAGSLQTDLLKSSTGMGKRLADGV